MSHVLFQLKSRKAKRRITFASLYLGTGELEQDLVNFTFDFSLFVISVEFFYSLIPLILFLQSNL